MNEAIGRAMELAKMKTVYIAGAYRGDSPYRVHLNVNLAEAAAFEVAKLGGVPVCPHTMYRNSGGTITDTFWLEATKKLLRFSESILVFDPDFEKSEGTRGEMQLAVDLELPMFLNTDRLHQWLIGEAGGWPLKQHELDRMLS